MIYGIGDIHGDYDRAVELLNHVGVVDSKGNWKGGDATLVCTGDSVDRGKFGWKVIQWFKDLEIQAEQAGGRAVHLLGNHDMWLIGFALATIKGYDPKQESWFETKKDDVNYLVQNPEALKWFMTRPVICTVGNVLFQHADAFMFYLKLGNRETTGDKLIQEINQMAQSRLQTDRDAFQLGDDLTFARHWDRKINQMDAYLTCFGVDHVVHGHTPTGVRSEPFFYEENKAILIDGIMSKGYFDMHFGAEPPANRGCVLTLHRDNWAFAV